MYTFGCNQYGQLACNNCKPRDVPAIVRALEEKTTTVRCKVNGLTLRSRDLYVSHGTLGLLSE